LWPDLLHEVMGSRNEGIYDWPSVVGTNNFGIGMNHIEIGRWINASEPPIKDSVDRAERRGESTL
jgi:hypothetical protein